MLKVKLNHSTPGNHDSTRFSTNLMFLLLVFQGSVAQLSPRDEIENPREEKAVVGVKANDDKWYTKLISDSGVEMGQVDLDDFPLKGLTDDQALGLLFQRYRARMMQEPRQLEFGLEDLSEREIGEICGNYASLECGKKVLKHIPFGTAIIPSAPEDAHNKESNTSQQISIFQRCNLRKEFLDCIDMQRKSCRRQADKGIYPRLPPKSIIRGTQSKIWRALWTAGQCTLIN